MMETVVQEGPSSVVVRCALCIPIGVFVSMIVMVRYSALKKNNTL